MSNTRASLLVVVGVVLHFFLSVTLVFVLISAAYAFSRTAGAEIGSFDELYRLGPAPGAAMFGLAVCGAFEFLIALVLLLLPGTRTRAWIVPVAGMALSVAIVVLAIATFQPAVPYVGG
jgi:hypothetical protein